MVKKSPSKEAIRGSIQVEYFQENLSLREITKKLSVSLQTVCKWKDRDTTYSKKRIITNKINEEVRTFIYNECVDKLTGIERASCTKVANKVFHKFKLDISHTA